MAMRRSRKERGRTMLLRGASITQRIAGLGGCVHGPWARDGVLCVRPRLPIVPNGAASTYIIELVERDHALPPAASGYDLCEDACRITRWRMLVAPCSIGQASPTTRCTRPETRSSRLPAGRGSHRGRIHVRRSRAALSRETRTLPTDAIFDAPPKESFSVGFRPCRGTVSRRG
jgi:hypothetical protein